MGKEPQRLEKGPKGKIHFDSLRATHKNVQNRKTQGYDNGLKN